MMDRRRLAHLRRALGRLRGHGPGRPPLGRRDLVDAPGRPWVTACQAPPSQPAALDAPMHLDRFEGVRRAGRIVATDLPVQRADQQPVEAKEPDQQVLHCAAPALAPRRGPSRARSRLRSRSTPSAALPAAPAAGSARTTTRVPGGRRSSRARARCRKRRFTRLRATELPTARLTTNPTEGAPPIGSMSTWTTTVLDAARRPRRVTSRNDDASLRRFAAASTQRHCDSRGRARSAISTSETRGSDGQALATLAPAVRQDRPTRAGAHPETETVHLVTATVVGLVGALAHDWNFLLMTTGTARGAEYVLLTLSHWRATGSVHTGRVRAS